MEFIHHPTLCHARSHTVSALLRERERERERERCLITQREVQYQPCLITQREVQYQPCLITQRARERCFCLDKKFSGLSDFILVFHSENLALHLTFLGHKIALRMSVLTKLQQTLMTEQVFQDLYI